MASADRRRWYQFRLRTLLLAVTAAAVTASAYRLYLEPYAQQRRAMEVIEELHGTYQSNGPTAWQRRLFGEDHQNLTAVNLADCDEPDRYVPYIARLPAIETLVVGGEEFGDSHLRRLSGLSTLRAFVLDSTSVTEEALAAWQGRLPEIEVCRSQRRAIRKLKSLGWRVDAPIPWSGWPRRRPIEDDPLANLADAPDFFIEAHRAIARSASNDALAPLRHLGTLKTLSLANSTITDAGLRHLSGLAQLGYLDLTNARINDAGLAGLKHCPNLVYLDVTGTQVTDEGLVHLRVLPKLGWLNLNSTSISHAGIVKHVAPIKSLRMLHLERTSVSPEETAALKEMLQPCVVYGPQSRPIGP